MNAEQNQLLEKLDAHHQLAQTEGLHVRFWCPGCLVICTPELAPVPETAELELPADPPSIVLPENKEITNNG